RFNFLLFIILLQLTILPQTEEPVWETVFEKSGYVSTPDYNQTKDYFQKLADYSEYAELHSFSLSAQKRPMMYFIASKEKDEIKNDKLWIKDSAKPTVLIINGIHSGEIEGKDASMLLLREILVTREKEYLLDSLNIIVIPIFNVDGHERKSKYNRINQNGPEEMGWRVTAQNYNLNRDWMKADSPEMQIMLKLINEWDPDFMMDTHTTNGADYQYTMTYSVEWSKNIYQPTASWLKSEFVPYLEQQVEGKGFLIHPYVYLKNWSKGFEDGIIYWPSTPRFSTGYFALRNRPSLLVETHMLKPYKDRVYSTKAVLEITLEFVLKNSSELKQLNKKADEDSKKLTGKYLPISFSNSDKYDLIKFKGYEYYWDSSSVSGTKKLVYTSNQNEFELKYFNDIATKDSVKVARGYIIPAEYSNLNFKLALHGIGPDRIFINDTSFVVTKYKFKNVKFASSPNEGRTTVNFDYDNYEEKVKVAKGSLLYLTDQKTARILTHFLEPKSSDSFVQWGFMNQIFEQKENYEDYVMEKLAVEMLTGDPELKREFEEKLKTDEAFRNNPRARLDFFYHKSPYPDKQFNIYPILRIE
ncbi:MAG TPA: M14 family metallopeptidase, partial [Ignavibacteriaceae bacterium]